MLCGAPGVGKGTYSRLLTEDFGYAKISTGDEIRKVLNNPKDSKLTPAALSQLKYHMNEGKLVPDEIIMDILYNRIKDPASSKGVILDGFPRTVKQLRMFTQVFPIHLAINIEQSFEYMMASMLGRRTCMDCGMSYSAEPFYKDGYELDVQMPKKEGVCDHCNGHVKARDDDKEDIIHARLREYQAKTFPILEAMRAQEREVIPFEAKRGNRDYPKLQQIIVSRVGLPCYYHLYNSKDYTITMYDN